MAHEKKASVRHEAGLKESALGTKDNETGPIK